MTSWHRTAVLHILPIIIFVNAKKCFFMLIIWLNIQIQKSLFPQKVLSHWMIELFIFYFFYFIQIPMVRGTRIWLFSHWKVYFYFKIYFFMFFHHFNTHIYTHRSNSHASSLEHCRQQLSAGESVNDLNGKFVSTSNNRTTPLWNLRLGSRGEFGESCCLLEQLWPSHTTGENKCHLKAIWCHDCYCPPQLTLTYDSCCTNAKAFPSDFNSSTIYHKNQWRRVSMCGTASLTAHET